jgi:serine/threonine-protein kinase
MSTGKTSKDSLGDAGEGLDLTGRTIADYRIERQLGQGGMGQVYLAEQVSLKRPVALKILRPDLASTPQALERFKREAQAVARATHANIVQVYDFGEFEGVAYMALEYVEGRNLKQFIARKGPPELALAISIIRQVAAALQRAGEMGIIHRDIKPENILLTRKGEVKVADFGLSRCLQGEQAALNLTQSGVTMGTPLYMSPEQVENKPLDPRTDIYSFGVTCYHMLTGQPPFQGESAFEVALQHVKKPPTPLSRLRPDLPEALCNIVHKMLAKDPDRRYQTAKDLLRDVARLREGLSGVAVSGAVSPTIHVDVPPAPSSAVSTPSGGAPTLTTPVPKRSRSITPTTVVLLGLGFLLSMLVAGAGGMMYAWKDRRREGPLPRGQVLPAADASVLDALHLPSKQEQGLREAVDRYLGSSRGKVTEQASGFGACADLALLYLDSHRLDDAAALFERLKNAEQPSCKMLGQLGRGIVLALRNQPDKSHEELRAIFQYKGKRKPPAGQFMKFMAEQLGPIRLVVENPRWRYWIARARWYNYHNGLPEERVPFLLQRIPLVASAAEVQR